MSICRQVHQLEFNKSQIDRIVGVNRDAVRKYSEKTLKKYSNGHTFYETKQKIECLCEYDS